jgi:hypothetical protein
MVQLLAHTQEKAHNYTFVHTLPVLVIEWLTELKELIA